MDSPTFINTMEKMEVVYLYIQGAQEKPLSIFK